MQPSRRPHSRCFALALLVLMSGGLSLGSAGPLYREFYVSPKGTDTNPGTRSRPFRTLTHARDVVRTVNRKMTGDIAIYLHGGTYPVSAPVQFQAEERRVGKECRCRWCAAP